MIEKIMINLTAPTPPILLGLEGNYFAEHLYANVASTLIDGATFSDMHIGIQAIPRKEGIHLDTA